MNSLLRREKRSQWKCHACMNQTAHAWTRRSFTSRENFVLRKTDLITLQNMVLLYLLSEKRPGSDRCTEPEQKEAPLICTWSVIWLIYARHFVILIFSTREFVIEDSVVQRDLPKIWSLFREMNLSKARDCAFESHKNAVFWLCEGCSLK